MSEDNGHCESLKAARIAEMAGHARRVVSYIQQWDQYGRLWGHEWEVVAWMALASGAIRDLDRKESLSGARRWISGWVASDDPRDRMVYKGLE